MLLQRFKLVGAIVQLGQNLVGCFLQVLSGLFVFTHNTHVGDTFGKCTANLLDIGIGQEVNWRSHLDPIATNSGDD
jgi:arginine utilization protein RocB